MEPDVAKQSKSLLAAILGWVFGGLLMVLGGISFGLGPPVFLLGLLVVVITSVMAPRHRIVGALATVGAAVAVGFVALSALTPGSSGVALTSDRSSYEPGDVVQVRLRNTFGQRIGYNLCFVQLQFRDDGRWHATSTRNANEACTSELRVMPPGGSATWEMRLPSGLTNGSYRLSHDVEVGDERQTITSRSFRVR